MKESSGPLKSSCLLFLLCFFFFFHNNFNILKRWKWGYFTQWGRCWSPGHSSGLLGTLFLVQPVLGKTEAIWMIFWRTDLPDWTTLSLIPVVIGLSFTYLQFHEILLWYLLIVYIPNGQLFLLPLGKVSYTEINSLACLKFSPPNMLFPYLQRTDLELWSSGVGYKIQETCPKSAVVKTPINWKREGCSEQV